MPASSTGLYSGGVFIFYDTGSTWSLNGSVLENPNTTIHTDFGQTVDITYGGDIVIIGDPCDNNDNDGTVNLYEWDGLNWNIIETITAPAGNFTNCCGSDVSISGSGYTFAIANSWARIFCIYEWNGTSFEFEGNYSLPAYYSHDIADIEISLDGSTIAVGSSDIEGIDTYTGGVSVFYNNGSWIQKGDMVIAEDGSNYDYFGQSVSLDENGNTLVIGSYGDDDNGTNSGSVYQYEWNGASRVSLGSKNYPGSKRE